MAYRDIKKAREEVNGPKSLKMHRPLLTILSKPLYLLVFLKYLTNAPILLGF